MVRRKENPDPLLFKLFDSKPSKGDQKKAEIIQAAFEIMVDEGLEGLSYESIAKKMGTRRSHVAYYFDDRSEILTTLFRYTYQRTSQSVVERLQGAKTPEEALDLWIDSQFDWFGKDFDLLKAKALFYYYAALHKEFRELQSEVLEGGHRRVELMLKNLGVEPKKTKRQSPAELAQNVQAIVAGQLVILLNSKREPNEENLRRHKAAARKAILDLIY